MSGQDISVQGTSVQDISVQDISVIDFHFHPARAECWYPWVFEMGRAVLGDDVFEHVNSVSDSAESILRFLDECGIDYAVVIPDQSTITTGMASNDYLIELCGGQERLIPVCSVNPAMVGDPVGEFVRCVEQLGCRGLKLYPTYQLFYPNERRLYPLYAKAEELGLPVLFHTGSSTFTGARLKYGDPLFIDDIAVDFPDLTLVMCHSGRGLWHDAAFFLARLHENVYMDVTGLPPQKLLDYFPDLERNADKILFGTDWPAVPQPGRNIEQIRALPIAEETKEKILWRNAARLLGL